MAWIVEPNYAAGMLVGYVLKDGDSYFMNGGGRETWMNADRALKDCNTLNAGGTIEPVAEDDDA